MDAMEVFVEATASVHKAETVAMISIIVVITIVIRIIIIEKIIIFSSNSLNSR